MNCSYYVSVEDEGIKAIRCIVTFKATGLDDIPARLIKDGVKGISHVLTNITNLKSLKEKSLRI